MNPALTNENATGSPVEYPGQVTKLFYTRSDFEAAVKKGENLTRRNPRVAIRSTPYRRQFKVSNFQNDPDFMKMYARSHLRGRDLNNTASLYGLAMPFLGIDLITIYDTPEYIDRLASVPEPDLLRAILHLFYDVKSFGDADIVHGDIKLENILFNFATNRFHLIDFDFVGTWDQFKMMRGRAVHVENPPLGAYLEYHPPDFFFILITREWLRKILRAETREEANKVAATLTQTFNQMLPDSSYFHNLPQHIEYILRYDRIPQQIREDIMRLYSEKEEDRTADKIEDKVVKIHSACRDTFDSYCTALPLFELFNHIGITKGTFKYSFLINRILVPMIDRYFITRRMTIEGAIETLEKHIHDKYPALDISDIRETPVREVLEEGLVAEDAVAGASITGKRRGRSSGSGSGSSKGSKKKGRSRSRS